MNNNSLFIAEHLRKVYNGREILTDVSLSADKGEAIFIVGKNGCGKSTLLRILSGLTNYDGGQLSIDKHVAKSFIPDGFEKSNMTAGKFMQYLYDIDPLAADTRILNEYYEKFSMTGMLDTPLKYLSKGSLQKLAVIQALISDRALIFMDEPLDGQDSISKHIFYDEMRTRKKRGTTLVIACHEKQIINELADKIYCLEHGVLVDGHMYVNGPEMNKGRFTLYTENAADLLAELEMQMPVTAESLNKVGCMGNKIEIDIDLAYVEQIFEYVLKHQIRIAKYEEHTEYAKESGSI